MASVPPFVRALVQGRQDPAAQFLRNGRLPQKLPASMAVHVVDAPTAGIGDFRFALDLDARSMLEWLPSLEVEGHELERSRRELVMSSRVGIAAARLRDPDGTRSAARPGSSGRSCAPVAD